MNTDQLYQERLNRYVTAMRNEKPDRIPIRPFVAEFTAKYAGYTSQQVSYDYQKAFDAALRCAADFDWDAVVPNMVYVWTGLTQAIGLRYYGIPGMTILAPSSVAGPTTTAPAPSPNRIAMLRPSYEPSMREERTSAQATSTWRYVPARRRRVRLPSRGVRPVARCRRRWSAPASRVRGLP